MLRNNLIVALRTSIKNRFSSLISIICISVGIISCLLIFSFVSDEFSHDSFHKNRQHIYRLAKILEAPDGTVSYDPLVNNRVCRELNKSVTGIIQSSSYSTSETVISYEKNLFTGTVGFGGKDFFNMFSFRFLKGNSKTALNRPDSIVITRSMADKFFGTDNWSFDTVVGNKVELEDKKNMIREFLITGIIEDIPVNSSLQFNCFINQINQQFFTVSYNSFGSKTLYINTEPGVNINKLQQELELLNRTVYSGRIKQLRSFGALSESDTCIKYLLQPLENLYMGDISNVYIKSSRKVYSYIISAVGILILLLSCINFISISLGLLIKNNKSPIIRKILGASDFQILWQFIINTGFLTGISMLISFAGTYYALPFFNSVSNKNLTTTNITVLNSLIFASALLLFITLIIACTRFLIYRKAAKLTVMHKRIPRNFVQKYFSSILILQFLVSSILLICTVTMSEQLNFMQNIDWGFNRENIAVVEIPLNSKDRFINACSSIPEIIKYSGTDNNFRESNGTMLLLNESGKKVFASSVMVDHNFIDLLELKILNGREFLKSHKGDLMNSVIINETLAKEMEWTNPVGKKLHGFNPGGKPPTVIGVVKDYNFSSVHNRISPMFMQMNYCMGDYSILLKIAPENLQNTIKKLRTIWNRLIPHRPFKTDILEEIIDKNYIAENRWRTIIGISTILSVLITLIGLIGQISVITGYRAKEISIRKVLGNHY